MVMWSTCRQNNSQRQASGQASLLLLFSDPAFRPTFLQQPWNFHFKMRVWQHLAVNIFPSSKNAFQILPEGGDVLFITPFWKVGFQEFLELLLHLCNPRDARVPVEVHNLFGKK